MPRRILVAAFAAALVLVMPGIPAAAKGPDSATISGSGIGTVKLTWSRADHVSLNTLIQVTRFFEGPNVDAWEPDPPAGDLGPRFDVTYHVYDGKPIHQDLYPFADAGPAVHMSSGQSMYDIPMPSGWLAAGDRLTQLVKRLGGTSRPVKSTVEPAAHESSTSSSGPAWDLIAVGAAGVALLAAATVGWRRLRTVRHV